MCTRAIIMIYVGDDKVNAGIALQCVLGYEKTGRNITRTLADSLIDEGEIYCTLTQRRAICAEYVDAAPLGREGEYAAHWPFRRAINDITGLKLARAERDALGAAYETGGF